MTINTLTLALLGGTGPEGRGLAVRWAKAGAKVLIGSRSAERAAETAARLNAHIGTDRIRGLDNKAAIAQSEISVLTVPFEHADSILDACQRDFRDGLLLIDATVPVSFEGGRARYLEPPEGSAAEHLREKLKTLNVRADLVGAFKTVPAHVMEDPTEALDCDDFIVGDSKQARERAIEAIKLIEGLRPIDAGPLENARVLERMTILAIGLNRRYKIKTGRYRFIGL